MTEEPNSTHSIQQCLDRLALGDESAREYLLQCAGDRLRRLTHKMLREFSRVRRWEETDDVYQNAALRLWRSLQSVQPQTAVDFLRFAATEIRRELIDLSRKHYGPEGWGRRHASGRNRPSTDNTPPPQDEPEDTTLEPGKLARWTEFHQHIAALPDDDRALFDLLWYQGLRQAEAAALLGVTQRTIERRWQSVRVQLHRRLRSLPDGSL